MNKENETLINLYSWCTDIEYKRWLIVEYLSSHIYRSRLELLFNIIKKYFESVHKHAKPDKPLMLPHLKFLKGIVKDYLHCRWTDSDDESLSDVFCPVKMMDELCRVFNSIKIPNVGHAMLFFIFDFEKNADKMPAPTSEAEKTDLEIILTGAISYPSPLLLESAILYILSQSFNSKGPIEFRVGSTIFTEFCSVIPGGFETIKTIPEGAPYFGTYLFYSICRKLANKLRAVVPLKSHYTTVTKIDGCPDEKILNVIIHYLRAYPQLIDGDKIPLTLSIPDLYIGETRQHELPSLQPFDDLVHISVGYSLWLPSIKPNVRKEIESLFLKFHAILLDVLASFKTVSVQKEEIKEKDESEEGEIEQGELIEDIDIPKDSPDVSTPYVRLVNFVGRIIQYKLAPLSEIDEIVERLAQILLISFKAHSFTQYELQDVIFHSQNLSNNPLFVKVISFMKENKLIKM